MAKPKRYEFDAIAHLQRLDDALDLELPEEASVIASRLIEYFHNGGHVPMLTRGQLLGLLRLVVLPKGEKVEDD